MGYRDDDEAKRLLKEALEKELFDVEERLRELEGLAARKTALEKELEASFASEAKARKRALPLLDAIAVKSPCKEPWSSMKGDDRVRHCARCDKDVYDLSALTREEAEALLSGADGTLCVRYFVRPDGTVLTSECAPGRRKRRVRAAGLVAGLGLSALGIGFAASDGGEPDYPEVMGAIPIQGEPTWIPPVEPPPPEPPSPDVVEVQGGVSIVSVDSDVR